MGIDYTSIVAEGLAKQIATSIRHSILTGALKVDDRLPTEEELAERFGVSRPTIREALKRLAAQNLVRSQRGPSGGTFVSRPSFEEARLSIFTTTTLLASIGEFELDEIADARAELETVCCRLAARNRRPSDIEAMRAELAAQQDPALTDQAFCTSDVAFHRLIAEATQNRVVGSLVHAILEALHPLANMTAVRYQDRSRVLAFHARLLDAIEAGDSDAAATAISEQIDYYRKMYALAREMRRARDAGPPAP
jgi:GntR family transcriptional regulator, transcriptional repressor for pyruvate dehydrogenase complex